MIRDESVQGWLDALAGVSATPGGGSCTAVMGAMAAALVSMVCRLTLAKSAPAALRESMEGTLNRSEAARARLTALIDEDTQAFGAVMAAYSLPRSSAQQRLERSAAIQTALHGATLVPLNCARASAEVLELSDIVSKQGHLGARGESGVAACAALAALRAAALNVRVNLGSIREPAFVDAQRVELEQIERHCGSLAVRINEMLAHQLG